MRQSPFGRFPLPLAACALALMAVPVAAHGGFGDAVETRFAFPAWVVWAAGALVVALSFAVVGGFLTRSADPAMTRAAPLRVVAVARSARLGWTAGRLVGALVLLLVVANGFWPGSDSVLPETALWLVVWVLLPLVAYTLGDVWPYVSPFHGLASFAAQARGGREPRPWPVWLGAWPAVVLLVALIGLEVAGFGWAYDAGPLALAVLAYTLLTVSGMAVFGAEAWLANAEVVTVMMRWWRAVSPVSWQRGRPHWRGFAASLAALPVRRTEDVVFTVAMLYGVNFDGFLATRAGAAALDVLVPLGRVAAHLVWLLVGLALFLGVWYVAARLVQRASESLRPVSGLAAVFAASLLPIAAGYHLAHNAFTLVEQAPRFLYAALDPVGVAGWPEPLVHVPLSLTLPVAGTAWFAAAQVVLVLVGHVVAVLAAHRLAERVFPGRIMALRGELPLTVVMVAYTWVGLWVLVGAGGAGGAAP